MASEHRRTNGRTPRRAARAAFLLSAAMVLPLAPQGCTSGPDSVEDPAAVMMRTSQARERYFDAIEAARVRGVDDGMKTALRRMISADGYPIDARERAFALLLEVDRAALVAAMENSLPRMGDVTWRRRVSELIGDAGLDELIPTLIRAWAVVVPGLSGDEVRPERLALAKLVGEARVSETLVRTMRESSPTTQANLRARCWELLMKNGDEKRLRALLVDPDATRGDAMLIDLGKVSSELGVLPVTREEILWARELCKPERAAFFEAAKAATARMSPERRESLEIRALPLAVACAARRPDLLTADERQLFDEVVARTKGRKKVSPDFTGYGSGFSETIYDQRAKVVWADVAAMSLALDLLAEEALLRHIFELADRDREDRSTEYGGVIALDAALRGDLLEFAPRTKASDIRYESPQALFDALYTGLFHFHMHAQKYDNEKYAGPHLGDFAFADSSRCNGLVFTFLSADLLDVDFYRHDRFVVDLGATERPQG